MEREKSFFSGKGLGIKPALFKIERGQHEMVISLFILRSIVGGPESPLTEGGMSWGNAHHGGKGAKYKRGSMQSPLKKADQVRSRQVILMGGGGGQVVEEYPWGVMQKPRGGKMPAPKGATRGGGGKPAGGATARGNCTRRGKVSELKKAGGRCQQEGRTSGASLIQGSETGNTALPK